MKNKGFTLVELLAVIVILAIIALIAIPSVIEIIDNSRNSVLLVNSQNYKEAVEKTILAENIGKLFKPNSCKIKNSELYCDDEIIDMKIDGQKPIEGEIKLENKKIKEMILRYSDEVADEIVMYKNDKYKIASFETYEGNDTLDLVNENESILYNYKIYNIAGLPILPNEYQEIEYIESTGTQYIDTGYVNSGDYNPYKIEVEFEFTDITTTGFIFGTVKTTTNSCPLVFGIDSSKNVWWFGHYGAGGDSIRFGTPDTNKHNAKYVFKEGLYLDGRLIEETVGQASTSSNSTKNIGLFARIRGTTPSDYAKLRMYSCKFYEANDVLTRYFIPCYRDLDNVVGLYDLVNNQFYENSGTGSFEPGPKIAYFGKYNKETGKYEIKISLMIDDKEYDNYIIVLDSPLNQGEYIDYKKGGIVRLDGTLEKIDLPELKITEPNTTLIIDEGAKIKIEVYK